MQPFVGTVWFPRKRGQGVGEVVQVVVECALQYLKKVLEDRGNAHRLNGSETP